VKNKLPIWTLDLILSVFAGLIFGAGLAGFSVGSYFQSWLAIGILFGLGAFALLRTWRFLGSSKSLAILLGAALGVRILMGVVGAAGLPAWGYDNPVNKAGFFYSDAYNRDQAAFKLASSSASLFTAFTTPNTTDQYGGLLFISAAIYRLISPDTARPLLISLLASFCMTLGIAFFWAAVQKRWPLKIASLAGWILALFPDGILLGSSQMREPFLIAFVCIAFWAILDWQQKPLRSTLIALILLALSCLFSIPAGGIFVAILASIVAIEWTQKQNKIGLRRFGFFLFAFIAAAALFAGWMWLRPTLYYDSYTTTQQSGYVQALIRNTFGQKWMIPFTSVYGLIQPVLPAAIMDPAQLIWKLIAIMGGLGWYLAMPVLFFTLFSGFKAGKEETKGLIVLFSLIFMVWVAVSSARAGGDQWDNPRYRYILLPFMSLLIAWGWNHYRETRSMWFWSWVAVFSEFFLIFMYFYLNRYANFGIYIPFMKTVGLILILAVLILGGSLLWDLLKNKHKGSKSWIKNQS
jgi:hypothetical protein